MNKVHNGSAKIAFFALILSGIVILQSAAGEAQYRWQTSEGSLALMDRERVVWQFNGVKGEGKPCFHPLTLTNGTCITELRPADHPWHRGLWWSWKHINGVNYWEESKKTGLSAGRTEVVTLKTVSNPDFSARFDMELSYHLPDKAPVMSETRSIAVSAPDAKGDYFIDWTATFTAGSEDLKLDRTPPKNFSGGYAGLSCRMSKACKDWTYTGSGGSVGATNLYGSCAKWIDFSKSGGIAIFDHPENMRHPTRWYPNERMPFFSPALLFKEPYTLTAGKTLTLRYRIWMHSSSADKEALERVWKSFGEHQGYQK